MTAWITPWTYNDQPFTSDMIGHNVGFVYLIEHIATGRKYIGKKQFHKTITKPPLKGSVRKRKIVSESDWMTYTGSNKALNNIIAKEGQGCIRKTILHLCRTKGEMSYLEAREQIIRDVLRSPEYFNDQIMLRVNSSHLPKSLITNYNHNTSIIKKRRYKNDRH